MLQEENISALLSATHFAAKKHRDQRRKNVEAEPYLNHPVEVAELLARVGEVTDTVTLIAAILHDTIEDTDTEPEEINVHFGSEVLSVVMEVTDDKSLIKAERKRLQIKNAPRLSLRGKQVKLADKISNISAMATSPPKGWPKDRQIEYLYWAENVVTEMGDCNPKLENLFFDLLAKGKKQLEE
jgi:guanosine-3',5'-bis(diphosphate) 3'-pyrophosphohydrolase